MTFEAFKSPIQLGSKSIELLVYGNLECIHEVTKADTLLLPTRSEGY